MGWSHDEWVRLYGEGWDDSGLYLSYDPMPLRLMAPNHRTAVRAIRSTSMLNRPAAYPADFIRKWLSEAGRTGPLGLVIDQKLVTADRASPRFRTDIISIGPCFSSTGPATVYLIGRCVRRKWLLAHRAFPCGLANEPCNIILTAELIVHRLWNKLLAQIKCALDRYSSDAHREVNVIPQYRCGESESGIQSVSQRGIFFLAELLAGYLNACSVPRSVITDEAGQEYGILYQFSQILRNRLLPARIEGLSYGGKAWCRNRMKPPTFIYCLISLVRIGAMLNRP
jgi:hypothetical protein